jgi:hypothetical protein
VNSASSPLDFRPGLRGNEPTSLAHSFPSYLGLSWKTVFFLSVSALFPVPTFGAHLAAAAGFPTPFSAANGVSGLVAGPSNLLQG